MSGDIVLELASAGASAVVGSFATDAWQYVRTRLSQIASRVGQPSVMEPVIILGDDVLRQEPSVDSEMVRNEARESVRSLLVALMERDPAVVDDIQALVALMRQPNDAQLGHQHAYADGDAQQAVQYIGKQENTFNRGQQNQ